MRKNASHPQPEGRRARHQLLPAKLKARVITLPRKVSSTKPALQMGELMPVMASGVATEGFFRRLFSFGSTPKAMVTTEVVR